MFNLDTYPDIHAHHASHVTVESSLAQFQSATDSVAQDPKNLDLFTASSPTRHKQPRIDLIPMGGSPQKRRGPDTAAMSLRGSPLRGGKPTKDSGGRSSPGKNSRRGELQTRPKSGSSSDS